MKPSASATLAPPRALRRVTLAAGDLDPLAWLAGRPATGARVYWQARDRALEVAGVGAAQTVVAAHAGAVAGALAQVQAVVAGDPELRCYGGLRFDSARAGDVDWRSFPACWFVVPVMECIRDAAGTRLVANVPADVSEVATHAALAESVRTARAPRASSAAHDARRDTPDRAGWERVVQSALLAMEACEIEKVVLARRTTLTFADALDPLALLARLCATTPACFHYGFQPAPGATFVGASPERLYRRRGQAIETEAVAGTRPRGATAEADRRLGEVLLSHPKERHEHLCVRDMIREALRSLGAGVHMDDQPSLLRLARGQHLFSGLNATLRAGVSDAEIIAALHPTPAVGGTPTPSALARIRAWEPFDRGWYAAPVGWIGRDEAEFAVAIRSALCSGAALALYAGAGIVPGSVPADEWDEIEHKIQDVLGVLREEGNGNRE